MERDDDFAFDFDERELFRAFRLAMPVPKARRQARRMFNAVKKGSGVATSEQLLLFLDLGSASGSEKVQRLRRVERECRFTTWVRDQRDAHGASVSLDDLRSQWATIVAVEDRAWEDRREALRRSLQEQGKLPPDHSGG
jgi:hypothetical protein